jgi:SAM-dependent methyltransferase
VLKVVDLVALGYAHTGHQGHNQAALAGQLPASSLMQQEAPGKVASSVQSDHPTESGPVPVSPARRKGAYGIDAPYLLPIPVVLILANVVNGFISKTLWPFLAAVLVLGCSASGLYASRRGKFVVWAELFRQLNLRGAEHILDLGCGRGAVLLLAAQHLTTGRAVGVDLWRKGDQSGNAAEATRRNAVAEGVTDRVELHTADMTALPFANESFDLVVSSVAIHNVKGQPGREKVIEEAVWVLRPGGRLLIADILGTGQYLDHLAKLRMLDVGRRGLGWRLWWSGPWLATRLVTATKPS